MTNPINETSSVNKWQFPDVYEGRVQPASKKPAQKSVPKKNTNPEQQKQNFDEGFLKGYQEGLAKANQEINEKLNLINNMISQLQNELVSKEQLEETLTNLSISIAKKAILSELKSSPESLKAVISKALSSFINDESSIVIIINNTTKDYMENILKDVLSDKELKFQHDDELPFGDFKIKTQSTSLGFSVEELVNEVCQSLMP